MDTNNPDWLPNQKLGHNYSQTKLSSQKRYERDLERQRHKSASALALLELQQTSSPASSVEALVDDESCPDSSHKSCQTDITAEKMVELQTENNTLKDELKKFRMNQDSFSGNDEKTLHFTGLPKWDMLLCLFNYINPYLLDSGTGSLDSFEKLILTLMRMKLNAYGKDLTYRFVGVSEATVSRTFKQVLDVLYVCLKPLIIWPKRDALRKNPANGLPEAFTELRYYYRLL